MFGEVIQASICGASHKHKGTECQDAFRVSRFGEDITILTVADGHGSESCPRSKIGAQIATDVFTKLMKKYFSVYSREPDTLRGYLRREGQGAVAKAIEREWKRRVAQDCGESGEGTWILYGTTLLGIVLTPAFYFAYRLGDGDVLEISSAGAVEIIKGNKLLGVSTYSLSQNNASVNALARVGEFSGNAVAVMLSTDGFANSYPDEDTFRQTCLEYAAAIREHGPAAVQEKLPEWLEETSREGSGDDVTVIIVKL
jgi:serine/threonine protein phosphatase PrpC